MRVAVVGSLALRAALDDPLAGVVVFVGLRVAVIRDLLNAVLLVPHNCAARAVRDVIPAGLVAVQVVAVGAVADEGRRVGLDGGIGASPVVGGLFLGDLGARCARRVLTRR